MKRTEQMLASEDALVAILFQFVTFGVTRSSHSNIRKAKIIEMFSSLRKAAIIENDNLPRGGSKTSLMPLGCCRAWLPLSAPLQSLIVG